MSLLDFTEFVFILSLVELNNGLICLECSDAKSHQHCVEIGKEVKCHENQLACQTEIRKFPLGRTRINKRCKQSDACFNDKPKLSTLPTQNNCDPIKPNTVCRCCCYRNRCSSDEATSCPEGISAPFIASTTYSEPRCPSFNLGLPYNNIKSFCSDGFRAGSACRPFCPFPYQLKGNAYISCQKVNEFTARWSSRPPCCTRFCPPFANMNLIIGIDSTKITSMKNWQGAKKFLKNLLRTYTLSLSDTSFGFFRFNDKIDLTSLIPIGKFRNKVNLLERIDRITLSRDDLSYRSYSPALKHALNEFKIHLRSPQHQKRRNILLLVTTGPSDDFILANVFARWLKDLRVELMALGISQEREELVLLKNQLNLLTERYNVFRSTADRLPSFVPKVIEMLCSNTCS